jgi:DNA (cytosine-5)-methyltransferase 1
MVLNSKFFGIPQNRERVFIVGNLRGECRPEILPFRNNAEKISGVSDEMWQMRLGHTKSESSNNIAIYDRKGFDSRTKGFRENENESPTLSVKMGTGGNNVPMTVGTIDANYFKGTSPTHLARGQIRGVELKGKLRRLTPIECERLQGFSDNWTKFGIDEKGNKVEISDTQRYKMCGNAVTVNVIETIAKKLLRMRVENNSIILQEAD